MGDVASPSSFAPMIDAFTRGAPRVVVVGGGNAGICAAISARLAGSEVVLLERGDEVFRGGNSRHTRDIRYAHDSPDGVADGSYPRDEFLADLAGVSDERSSGELAGRLADGSTDLPRWMSEQGVKWQSNLRGSLHLSRTNAFFLGGGRALLNTYYDTAARLGVRVVYESRVVGPVLDGRRCVGLEVRRRGQEERIEGDAFVLAAGSIEANMDWLRDQWGDGADNFVIRGSAGNDGSILLSFLEAGAASVGDERAFHAVAVDARSPRFDGGIVTRVDATPFGIVVNRDGRRFHDEGETFWPKRYAIWGGLIATQPGQSASVIFDSKVRRLFIPPLFPPLTAPTIEALAGQLGIPIGALTATVTEFNRSVIRDRTFDPAVLDGLATTGITPPKSNWAQPIDTPPFHAFPLRPGITFSYRGLRVDGSTRVLDREGRPFENVFAAGELMAGNILTSGYLAGIGLTIGTVFGRIAGEEAATVAARRPH
jgi:tricarballylate dehydrogenase